MAILGIHVSFRGCGRPMESVRVLTPSTCWTFCSRNVDEIQWMVKGYWSFLMGTAFFSHVFLGTPRHVMYGNKGEKLKNLSDPGVLPKNANISASCARNYEWQCQSC